MLEPKPLNVADANTEGRNLDLNVNEHHRHPLGASIGAVLAAGTACATGGALIGPVGAIVGAVVGAIAGGLGGRAIAELVESPHHEEQWSDTYTTRQHHSHAIDEEQSSSGSSSRESTQAPREAWGRLDQSSKELLDDTASEDE